MQKASLFELCGIEKITTKHILGIYLIPTLEKLFMKATSFKFDEKTTELIDKLKENSHASSRTEVLRKALYLLDLASTAQQENKHLIIKGAEGETEKEILIY